MGRSAKAEIACIEPGSPADVAGIKEGELVEAVDGQPVSDILDWQWLSADDEMVLTLSGKDHSSRLVNISRPPGTGWGIEFSSAIFDRVRTCQNDCVFCFISQLPAGLRDSLYVRDDDYRLSFLYGNFVTLTNLTELDVERIIEQQLSPLYVSLHSADAAVRERIVRTPCDRALERVEKLLAAGIEMHIQIVLVPGENDGTHLEQTLDWLERLDGVVSVGIVPLGYTAHQSRFSRSFEDPLDAARVISQVAPRQHVRRMRDKMTWVYLADEFYLNALAPLPEAFFYDDFPQYENGIGIARAFVDDFEAARDRITESLALLPKRNSISIVSGEMAAGILADAFESAGAGQKVRVLGVANRFFGGNVKVTGLLTGRDIVDVIAADNPGGESVYIVPKIIFNSGGVTLDGFTADDLESLGDKRVAFVSSDSQGLLEALALGIR
ncbi:MAG: DUF512 domain-containing protein [Actinobacteria bacterium]|nr:DUF512 domain-containing protein [Actinomycetota bacterium]